MAKRKSRSGEADPAAATEKNSRPENPAAATEKNAMAKKRSNKRSAADRGLSAEQQAEIAPFMLDKPEEEDEVKFLGEPVADAEARSRWPHRYQNIETEIVQAKRHFLKAEVDGQVYDLEDDAYVQSDPGKPDYIGKVVEIFEAVNGSPYFTAQWFYRGSDTVLRESSNLLDEKCIFISHDKDDNPLGCLVKKLKIEFVPLKAEHHQKEALKSECEFYYDKKYSSQFSSFISLPSDSPANSNELGSTVSSDADGEVSENSNERTLLDLYSGCGAMSTGLCLGANSCGVKLVTKWAVDINQYACESLRLNHPETQVRNEPAENFLNLLKEWEKLTSKCNASNEHENDEEEDADKEDEGGEDAEVYEVEDILAVCYGDLQKKGSYELFFKIRWKRYTPEYDTWEPLECLDGCREKLKDYVSRSNEAKMLPLPGIVDVICGGPPCQGISGFNRFRDEENPLNGDKNKQLSIFMDIVDFLRPKFVLMENVVDILKFAEGFLGRYALGRLLSMNYQARIGLIAAGAYGLPQFRMRMFMWGALPTEKLPQFPMPTHNVVVRGHAPNEFEANVVAYEKGREVKLASALYLTDAISDMPPVENDEERDEIPYNSKPDTEFQRFIRLPRNEMPGSLLLNSEMIEHSLYDHRPLKLNEDDLERVCQIPKKKGANFRDLRGLRVGPDNVVELDPNVVERPKVTSGKPLVPDYAILYKKGKSLKPFGRLWWDETVPTVVTRAEPHNQIILHPLQDRVLTIRENARLQGFPDYYKLLGPIKERYTQVGNAVAVPVARALGFSLGLALTGVSGNEPTMTLPDDYPLIRDVPVPDIVML